MQSNYGIAPEDVRDANTKIQNQRHYMSTQTAYVVPETGVVKSFLDVTFSANHSSRYYSELLNRIYTLQEQAQERKLVPYFLTITLDGFYRDLKRGDYSKVPDDLDLIKAPGHVKEKIEKQSRLSVRDLNDVIQFQWQSFVKHRAYKDINNKFYVRVVEPHKDGTPHNHVILLLPEDADIPRLHQAFINSFPAPRNFHEKSFIKADNGFTGYVLKYVLKSFRNVEDEAPIDDLQAWYIKHKIRRVTMSNVMVPAWVYRKASYYLPDWNLLTKYARLGSFVWDFNDDWFYLEVDDENGIEYEKGELRLMHCGDVIHKTGAVEEVFRGSSNPVSNDDFIDDQRAIVRDVAIKKQYREKQLAARKLTPDKWILLDHDGIQYKLYPDGDCIPLHCSTIGKTVDQMSNLELIQEIRACQTELYFGVDRDNRYKYLQDQLKQR